MASATRAIHDNTNGQSSQIEWIFLEMYNMYNQLNFMQNKTRFKKLNHCKVPQWGAPLRPRMSLVYEENKITEY